MVLNEQRIPYEEYHQLGRFFKIENTLPDDRRIDNRDVLYIHGQSEKPCFSFISRLTTSSETAAWKNTLETYAFHHSGKKKPGRIPWKIVTFICRRGFEYSECLHILDFLGKRIAKQYGIELVGCYLTNGELSAVIPLYTDDIKICSLPVARVIFSYTDRRGVTVRFPKPWPEKSYYLWREFRNIVAYLPEHFEATGEKEQNNNKKAYILQKDEAYENSSRRR